MTLLKEIAAELAAMFVGDARLALCVLAMVGGAAALVRIVPGAPLAAGAVLLFGCLLILIESVRHAASGRRGR
jgi:hypothetical protein